LAFEQFLLTIVSVCKLAVSRQGKVGIIKVCYRKLQGYYRTKEKKSVPGRFHRVTYYLNNMLENNL
jgi:hypothetical protein